MDVRNCRSCGKMFSHSSGASICDACKAALERKFDEVKAYVREYSSAPLNKVAEDCEVSVRQIKQWVREERLILSEEVGNFLSCENCGAAIRTGRFCQKCKGKLQNDFKGAYESSTPVEPVKPKVSDKNRMRFLDL